jgi:hypothetical protein
MMEYSDRSKAESVRSEQMRSTGEFGLSAR